MTSPHEGCAICLVVPPIGFADRATPLPAPVLLFLTGVGHIDDKEDFLQGGVDLLLRNPVVRRELMVVAPKPTSDSGILRVRNGKRYWSEDGHRGAPSPRAPPSGPGAALYHGVVNGRERRLAGAEQTPAPPRRRALPCGPTRFVRTAKGPARLCVKSFARLFYGLTKSTSTKTQRLAR